MKELLTATISAVTSILVVLVTYGLNSYRETKSKEKQEAERVISIYLNPLRLYLAENYFRLAEILQKITQEGGKDDTALIALITRLSLCFRQDYGIYYLIQPSIGNDMYLVSEKRLITYREFCQLLQNPETRVWFDRLLNFYIETGQGQKLKRIEAILGAIQSLSLFLDRVVGGGNSIQGRLEVEGIKAL